MALTEPPLCARRWVSRVVPSNTRPQFNSESRMPRKSRTKDAACADIVVPERARIDLDTPPATRVALHRFLREVLSAEVALTPLLDPGISDAPMASLYHAFFEGLIAKGDLVQGAVRGPASTRPRDCVVWANRGGGKTFLGA